MMLTTTRLARCLACAAVVLATVTSSTAIAAPGRPAKTPKVVAKEKAPAARHPFKKAKSATPKVKPPKAKKPAKPSLHPSGSPHADTHPA